MVKLWSKYSVRDYRMIDHRLGLSPQDGKRPRFSLALNFQNTGYCALKIKQYI